MNTLTVDSILRAARHDARVSYDDTDVPYFHPVVYILEFEGGIVKVGQTADFDSRLSSNSRHPNVSGRKVVREWWQRTNRALEDEATLIALIGDLGGVLFDGREWFTGFDVESLIDSAQKYTVAAPRPPFHFPEIPEHPRP